VSLRWLVPVVAAITIAGSPVISLAAAALAGESECCCPVRAKCKCHDHDGSSRSESTLQRCGNAGAPVVPVVALAITPSAVTVNDAPRTLLLPTAIPEVVPEDRVIEPDTPPF
jgi:hypothetical protein